MNVIPKSREDAEWKLGLVQDLTKSWNTQGEFPLSRFGHAMFLGAWCSIFFLHPGLHPDGYDAEESGWPEDLQPFAAEAWRRHDDGEFTEAMLYPCEAQAAGIDALKLAPLEEVKADERIKQVLFPKALCLYFASQTELFELLLNSNEITMNPLTLHAEDGTPRPYEASATDTKWTFHCCEPDDPNLACWSVYAFSDVHDCLADFETEADALKAQTLLEQLRREILQSSTEENV